MAGGFDYGRMKSAADRLLDRFQQGAITLVMERQGVSLNGVRWEPGVITTTREALAGVVRGVDQKFVDGATILSSDLMVLCAVPAARPEMGSDWVEIDGRRHNIVRSEPIPAAGAPVAWRLIVRA